MDVAEVGDADEPGLGAVQPVGVEQHEPLDHHRPRALGVGQVGGAEQLADLGQRLVVAPERGEHAEGQVASAGPGPGELAAAPPTPPPPPGSSRRPAAGPRGRRTWPRTRPAPRWRGRRCGSRRRRARPASRSAMRTASSRRPSARRARADSTATRRRSAGAASAAMLDGPVDVGDGLVDPAERLGSPTPAAAGEPARDRSSGPRRASRPSIRRGSTVSVIDSLRPITICVARSWSPASSSRPTASSGRPRSSSSTASSPAVAGSAGAARNADAAARSNAPVTCRRSGMPAATARSTKPAPGQLVEQVAVDPGRPGQQRDHRLLAGVEVLQRGRAGDADHPRGEGDRIGRRVRGGAGRATVAMTRTLPSAASTICRASVIETARRARRAPLRPRWPSRRRR